MTDDYLELYADLSGERETCFVHDGQRIVTVCHGTNSVIRYRGMWTISHLHSENLAATLIPADQVTHFTFVSASKDNRGLDG